MCIRILIIFNLYSTTLFNIICNSSNRILTILSYNYMKFIKGMKSYLIINHIINVKYTMYGQMLAIYNIRSNINT